jgi:hypothetical protein
MIAAIVVPFVSRSIASTVSCLEEDGAAAFGDAGFDVTALDEAVDFDRAAPLLVGSFLRVRVCVRPWWIWISMCW